MSKKLQHYLHQQGRKVDQALDRLLPQPTVKPSLIHRAMRYSVKAGGKRLRPILVMAAAELCGGRGRDVMPTACAMELIHTYSLIHDDLPAMDNDDLRRGKPTNHKVFGEDIAILAGDALLTQAFSLVAMNAAIKGIPPKAVAQVTTMIAEAAGSKGMIAGQVVDIISDGGQWKKRRSGEFSSPQRLLEFIHMQKTAALIRASLLAGAYLMKANSKTVKALDNYGRSIGLAFQIADDILDQVGDKKKLGKKGSDTANQKLTYPALFGLEASRKKARDLVSQAHQFLRPFGSKASIFHELADFIVARDH